MSQAVAFRMGWLPAVAGIYFNGDELLRRMQPAPEEQRPALTALAKRLDERGRETVGLVLEAERWFAERGLPSPGRPRQPDEYRRWAEAVAREGQAAFGGDVAAGAARLLGLNLGDLCLTVALHEYVADLLAAAPGNDFLEKQETALAEEERRGRHDLALAARSVGLPPAVEPIAERIAEADLDELLALRPELAAALGG
jgi:hypothetical protein